MIADALKLEKIRILHCPPLAVYIAGLGGEFAKKFLGKTPPFDWNKAKESLRGPWICSNEKGEKQLKFHPEKPLRRRLEQTAQWYQEQGWMR